MSKTGRSSSLLFLGLAALAPVLGGADGSGGCNGRLVPIGHDPGTGGSAGSAGAAGETGGSTQAGGSSGYAGTAGNGGAAGKTGVGGAAGTGNTIDAGPAGGGFPGDGSVQACGTVLCPAGQVCCNASCGICVPPGYACTQQACIDLCAPYQAAGDGACDKALGFAWDGKSCVPLGGCSCRGADCARLYPDQATCQLDHAKCPGSVDPCGSIEIAIRTLIAVNQKCNVDGDCGVVSVSCLPGSSCTGAQYVNRSLDQATLLRLQGDLNACVNGDRNKGCPVCLIADPAPACVNGLCQPMPAPDPECLGRACGEQCPTPCTSQPCPPVAIAFCDANGKCGGGAACPPLDPCAGKKCGDQCSTCTNQPCPTIVQWCDAKGQCGGSPTCP